MEKNRRKTFACREDLLDRLTEMARSKGLSLYSLVNEVFEAAIRVEEANLNLGRMVDEYRALEKAKESGFILVHEGLWNEVAEEIYRRDEGWASERWFEAGEWLAKRLPREGEDPFEAFRVNMESVLWNVSEFTMRREGGEVIVHLIGPRFSPARMMLLSSLFEGALAALGYRVVSREVTSISIELRGEAHAEA